MSGGFQFLLPEMTPERVCTSNQSVKAEVSGGERGQAGQASDRPKQHWMRERPGRGDGSRGLEAEGLRAVSACRLGAGFARGIRTRSARGLRGRSLVRRHQARCGGRSLRAEDIAGGDGGGNRHNRRRGGRRGRYPDNLRSGTGIRGRRKKRYLPPRSPKRQRGQEQEDEEGHRPKAVADLGGLPPHKPGEHKAGRQDDRSPECKAEYRRRFDPPWEGGHRPSSEASSIIAMIRSRSSGLSVPSSSASRVATAPSTEPPKKVVRTCRIAPRRARTTGTRGE